jgi:DNA-directed RNA polymerase specialized sigma24 family protein
MNMVRRALGSLNQDDLLMLVLTRLEGLSLKEAAEVLGITTEAAALSLRGAEENLLRGMSLDGTRPAEERAS